MPGSEIITAIDGDGSLFPIGKLDAHRVGQKHLAISVFVFQGDHLLLQRRADGKYHSGGLWANTCCSHPRWGESPANCAARRLGEELGWSVPLHEFAVIDYSAAVGDLYENERVHCFRSSIDTAPPFNRFNPDEVQALRWRTLTDLEGEIGLNPESYSEWIKIYVTQHRHLIEPDPTVSAERTKIREAKAV